MITAHADVVGRLLPPAELLAAQKQLAVGTITAVEFKEIEDRAVDEAIALQESVGLEVVDEGDPCPRQDAAPGTTIAGYLQALSSISWMRERMG
jgi:methionine synthase II (cobalamin-independent)